MEVDGRSCSFSVWGHFQVHFPGCRCFSWKKLRTGKLNFIPKLICFLLIVFWRDVRQRRLIDQWIHNWLGSLGSSFPRKFHRDRLPPKSPFMVVFRKGESPNTGEGPHDVRESLQNACNSGSGTYFAQNLLCQNGVIQGHGDDPFVKQDHGIPKKETERVGRCISLRTCDFPASHLSLLTGNHEFSCVTSQLISIMFLIKNANLRCGWCPEISGKSWIHCWALPWNDSFF